MSDSKWIDFIEQPATGITKIFDVVPKDELHKSKLGQIRWYSPWRCYCFWCNSMCIFETQCLGDIKRFIDALMLDRKIKKQEAKQ